MASFFRTYRMHEGKRIDGVFFLAFIHNGDYHLSPISIYQDGLIDCWGLVDFEGFKDKVRSGWVVTRPPRWARVTVTSLGHFRTVGASYSIEPEELIKAVADEIEELNQHPSSLETCYQAYESFQDNPTQETREALRHAYEAVPKHKRHRVLHDMDLKDIPIRMILYGEKEIENWSHRIAARRQGIRPLPWIKVKTVESKEEGSKEVGEFKNRR